MAKARAASKVDLYFKSLSPKLAKCAEKLRKTIFEVEPNVTEELKWSQPCYGKVKDVCYISGAKAHITFGFFRGTELDDPHGRLEGTGKGMRHVKIKDPGNVDGPVKQLIKDAFALDRSA